MPTNVKMIQKVCENDYEYKEALELQRKNNELDPEHKELPRVIVIDCRLKY